MRKHEATSRDFSMLGCARFSFGVSGRWGWGGALVGEVWGCFHISAPQPKAEDAAGLVLAVFAPLVTWIFPEKKPPVGSAT